MSWFPEYPKWATFLFYSWMWSGIIVFFAVGVLAIWFIATHIRFVP